jgi:hypothetical protein
MHFVELRRKPVERRSDPPVMRGHRLHVSLAPGFRDSFHIGVGEVIHLLRRPVHGHPDHVRMWRVHEHEPTHTLWTHGVVRAGEDASEGVANEDHGLRAGDVLNDRIEFPQHLVCGQARQRIGPRFASLVIGAHAR